MSSLGVRPDPVHAAAATPLPIIHPLKKDQWAGARTQDTSTRPHLFHRRPDLGLPSLTLTPRPFSRQQDTAKSPTTTRGDGDLSRAETFAFFGLSGRPLKGGSAPRRTRGGWGYVDRTPVRWRGPPRPTPPPRATGSISGSRKGKGVESGQTPEGDFSASSDPLASRSGVGER